MVAISDFRRRCAHKSSARRSTPEAHRNLMYLANYVSMNLNGPNRTFYYTLRPGPARRDHTVNHFVATDCKGVWYTRGALPPLRDPSGQLRIGVARRHPNGDWFSDSENARWLWLPDAFGVPDDATFYSMATGRHVRGASEASANIERDLNAWAKTVETNYLWDNWVVEDAVRKTGKTKGKRDYYFYHPELACSSGTRIRSKQRAKVLSLL